MKKLTDVTRQDLFDIIRDGFVLTADPPIFNKETNCFESSYNVRMPFGGRLSELDFLGRIYDLKSMPSSDRRFANAYGDIHQHTVNNDNFFPDKNEYTMELMDCTLYDYISRNNATLTLSQRKSILFYFPTVTGLSPFAYMLEIWTTKNIYGMFLYTPCYSSFAGLFPYLLH